MKTVRPLLTTDNDLAGKSIRLPEELRSKILEDADGFQGYTTLSGLYKNAAVLPWACR